MSKNKKLFGLLIIFTGVFLVSFGGLVVKSFNTQNPWIILFWRQFFFTIIVIIFLLLTYRKNISKLFLQSNLVSILMGFGLSFGFIAFVYSMLNTSVANVNFINTTQVIFLTIFSVIFLKEKINLNTLISIMIAIIGVVIIFYNSFIVGDFRGNLIAFSLPLCFAAIVILVKKFPKADLTISGLIASIFVMIIALFRTDTITISNHDILLALSAGTLQTALPFVFLIIASKYISSSLIGLIMLMEALLGPTWAYLFINDIPSINVFVGGTFILLGVISKLYQTFYKELSH